jgi:hypothetical protein
MNRLGTINVEFLRGRYFFYQFVLKALRERAKSVYLWYVAVEGAKMAVVLGWSGSEGLAGTGNTGLQYRSSVASRPKILQNNSKPTVEKNCLQRKIGSIRPHFWRKVAENRPKKNFAVEKTVFEGCFCF